LIIFKMGKKYKLVSDAQRQQLINLIHKKEFSITEAAKLVGIVYPTAKAINNVYLSQNRVFKKRAGVSIKTKGIAKAPGCQEYYQRRKLSLRGMTKTITSLQKTQGHQ
jgi:hypothetical protein